MKNLFIIVMLMLTVSLTQAQDFEQTNYITVVTSPGSWDDGASVGIQYEYQNNTVYVGPELYLFPNLHDMNYTHLIGRLGLNKHFGKLNHWGRIYSGTRIGGIFREGNDVNALLGLEAGFDIYIKNIYFRVSGTSDMKTDSKIWSNESHHTVNSLIAGVGVKF